MIPNRITGANITLGQPDNWDEAQHGACMGLPARVEVADGLSWLVSEWQPTEAERAKLAAGAPVVLKICGKQHPVVALCVGDGV